MAIVNAQLTTTQLDVLTVPAGKTYAITNILVCNTDNANPASFDLHFIPEETFTFDSERIILEAGDKVSFVAEPNLGSGLTDLAATVSYLEV
jgi:hypothetical protein